MRRMCVGASLLAMFLLTSCFRDEDYPASDNPPAYPGTAWELVANPAAMGWDAALLDEARDIARKNKSEAVMIVDDGRLVAAWGETRKKFYVASVRKSLLSLLYGYYADSLIMLDSTIGHYGLTEKNTTLTPQEQSATVRHLLTSSSGIFLPAAASDNEGLPARGSQAPGTAFYYNNWDFNALGTLFEQQTGKKIFEEFNSKIGLPIGLQDFRWQIDGRYDYSDVSQHPAYHFDMTAEDMARIGLLVLRNGQWNGVQVVPADWLAESTRPHLTVPDTYGGGGYGYMWWTHNGGEVAKAGLSATAFSAQGNWSQLILVDPERKLVIVHRAHKRTIDPEKSVALIEAILNAKS